MTPPEYVVITPVRNEENHFGETITSMVCQTLRPMRWVIVNDGSGDRTGELADRAAREHDWIWVVHRKDRGYRNQGGGVVEAFYEGYRLVKNEPWEFLSKLDGDLSFAHGYFADCLEQFAADPKLGIGGGSVWSRSDKGLFNDGANDPKFHVRGATKIYRRAAWADIGGLMQTVGWDTIDEVKANMFGWTTRSFTDLKTIQHKATGAADGVWKNWFKNGNANYIVGYHPLFMSMKCLRRMLDRPFLIAGVALAAGFLSGYIKRTPQVPDIDAIRYLRRQQINRLRFRDNLWCR
jgi:poly-beta-1,6-N-acetyl-D-glucosamine synthase